MSNKQIGGKRIKNRDYLEFLNKGTIKLLTQTEVQQAIDQVKPHHRPAGPALISLLYLTGARPTEILRLKAKHITLEPRYIQIQLLGSKGGLPRKFYIKKNHPLAKYIIAYRETCYPEIFMFYKYRGIYVRHYVTKSGKKKTYHETSDKLRYHFKKWFRGVRDQSPPPYFCRHSRFSSLAEKGASLNTLKLLKGNKTMAAVECYIHLTTDQAKKTAKLIT